MTTTPAHSEVPLDATATTAAPESPTLDPLTLLLRNVPLSATREDLDELFGEHKPKSVRWTPKNRRLQMRLVFVSYETEDGARAARSALEGSKLGDSDITVQAAYVRESRPRTRKATNKQADGGADEGAKSADADAQGAAAGEAGASAKGEAAGKRKPWKHSSPRPHVPREYTDDTVYLRLPLSVTEDDVKALFADFEPKSIVMRAGRRLQRKPQGGVTQRRFMNVFVNVGAGNQQRAIDEVSKKEFRDRNVIVNRASVPRPEKSEDEAGEATATGASDASDKPADEKAASKPDVAATSAATASTPAAAASTAATEGKDADVAADAA